METPTNSQSPEATGVPPPAPGSDPIIVGFGGVKLRKINPQRMLKTGDKLGNMHGQFLWEVIAFHTQGARVIEWPHSITRDWKWEHVYSFYERVEAEDQNIAVSQPGQPLPKSSNSSAHP